MLPAVKQLQVLIERASKYYIKKHIDKYTTRLDSVVSQWRKWVKQQLSVPYVKGERNTTLYPKLRSGALRASLTQRRVQVKKIDELGTGRAQAKIIVPITYAKLKGNYGDILNSRNATYGGWKDRVLEVLEQRIKGRV